MQVYPCGCKSKALMPYTLCPTGLTLFEKVTFEQGKRYGQGDYGSSWQLTDDARAWFRHFQEQENDVQIVEG